MLSPKVRLWAYGVTAALLAVAAVYGLVSGDEVQAWLVVASAVLGVAMRHVPPQDGELVEPGGEFDEVAPRRALG